MTPSPTRQHQTVVRRLANRLEAAISNEYAVATEWAWKPARDEYIPNVMVHPATTEQVRITGRPVLCAEVLSTNRASDHVTKVRKYAVAGLPRYWITDPTFRVSTSSCSTAITTTWSGRGHLTTARSSWWSGLGCVVVDLNVLTV